MPTGLHSVRKLSVTAPPALPAGCSTSSTQASLNSSLPNVAGHYVNRHLPQQPHEQQTVTQPLRSVHHAEQSEAAVALLPTGVRNAAADAGGQPSAGRHLAVEALGGDKRSRHDYVERSLVTGSVDTEEELEVGAHVIGKDKNPFVSNITQRAISIRLVFANVVSCHMFAGRSAVSGSGDCATC